MEVIIRNIRLEDLEDIMEVEKEAFTTPWSKEAFKAEINGNDLAYYIVALVEEKVVAYGGIWLIINEGHITNIAVKKEYKGRGIGNKIVEALIYHCVKLGIDNMTLEVRASNHVAIGLYEKYGFLDYGRRPNYYADDGEDAIIMWRTNRI